MFKNFSFGPLASASSFLNICFPIPTIYNAVKNKTQIQLPTLLYSVRCLFMLIRYIWAMKINSYYLIFIGKIAHNSFFVYTISALYLKKLYDKIFIFVVLFLALKYVVLPNLSESLLGSLGITFQIIYLLSNTEMLVKAYRYKARDFINLKSMLLALPAGILWTFLGLEERNAMIYLPSLGDLTFILAHIYLYSIYPLKGIK